jgi:DNA-binding LytR/AlgR family response regulator
MIVKTKLHDVNWFYNLDWRDILCVQQDADYQIFDTKSGPLRVYGTMDTTLAMFPQLIRIHRSWLVNLHELQGYAPNSEDQSVMLFFKNGVIKKTGRSRTFYDQFVEEYTALANDTQTYNSLSHGNQF